VWLCYGCVWRPCGSIPWPLLDINRKLPMLNMLATDATSNCLTLDQKSRESLQRMSRVCCDTMGRIQHQAYQLPACGMPGLLHHSGATVPCCTTPCCALMCCAVPRCAVLLVQASQGGLSCCPACVPQELGPSSSQTTPASGESDT
jgi:hypothetical protein